MPPGGNAGPPTLAGWGLPERAGRVLQGLAPAADAAHACLLSHSLQQSRSAYTEIHMTSAQTSTRKIKSVTTLQTMRTALAVAGAVLCFGMLSFFVHLVQSQVTRGEAFREAQRAGLYRVKDGSLLRPGRASSAQNGPQLASASPR